jgi:hypothetical protein
MKIKHIVPKFHIHANLTFPVTPSRIRSRIGAQPTVLRCLRVFSS